MDAQIWRVSTLGGSLAKGWGVFAVLSKRRRSRLEGVEVEEEGHLSLEMEVATRGGAGAEVAKAGQAGREHTTKRIGGSCLPGQTGTDDSRLPYPYSERAGLSPTAAGLFSGAGVRSGPAVWFELLGGIQQTGPKKAVFLWGILEPASQPWKSVPFFRDPRCLQGPGEEEPDAALWHRDLLHASIPHAAQPYLDFGRDPARSSNCL
jgi:hypothetical protein